MYDVLIIGAGITGAAAAFELSKYNLKVAVLDKANDVSTGTTKANSAIIHAGFDPKPGTLMAKLNVRGANLIEEICAALDIPYDKCGALVVAFDEESIYTLEQLESQAKINNVEGCRLISGDEAREMEPYLSKDVIKALYAPTSAIICPWEFCLALAETAVKNGAELFLNSEVTDIKKENDFWKVSTVNGIYRTKYIINAAGVEADKIHDMVSEHDFTIVPTVGQYYLLDKPEGKKAKRTIFQCPTKTGKGVLVTPTVHGNLLVGPNTKVVDGNNTATSVGSLAYVRSMGSKSVPKIDFSQNIRNFAGVRARTDEKDFIIREAKGAEGFIDAAGICSPGLSAAPAIAEYIVELLENSGLVLHKKDNFIFERKHIRFKDLSVEEKQHLVNEHPAYGHVICRCETVTEGEILDTFHSVIPPVSVDGIKRRVGTSMGRCQGGFCSTQIVKILADQLNISESDVIMETPSSWILEDMREE